MTVWDIFLSKTFFDSGTCRLHPSGTDPPRIKVHYGGHLTCEYGDCVTIRLACSPDNKFLQSPTWRHVTRDTNRHVTNAIVFPANCCVEWYQPRPDRPTRFGARTQNARQPHTVRWKGSEGSKQTKHTIRKLTPCWFQKCIFFCWKFIYALFWKCLFYKNSSPFPFCLRYRLWDGRNTGKWHITRFLTSCSVTLAWLRIRASLGLSMTTHLTRARWVTTARVKSLLFFASHRASAVGNAAIDSTSWGRHRGASARGQSVWAAAEARGGGPSWPVKHQHGRISSRCEVQSLTMSRLAEAQKRQNI